MTLAGECTLTSLDLLCVEPGSFSKPFFAAFSEKEINIKAMKSKDSIASDAFVRWRWAFKYGSPYLFVPKKITLSNFNITGIFSGIFSV